MKVKLIERKDGLIEPKTHKVLFMHCSGGSEAVTQEFYQDAVKELLFLHGATAISMEPEQ